MAVRTSAPETMRYAADTQTRETGAQAARTVEFNASSGAVIVLPSGQFAADASYLQQGDDLLVIGPDGTTVVVSGYFLLDNPPDLMTPEGGRITPALVNAFTPPEASGQYAQAGQVAQAAAPIGQVKDITGQAFAVRIDGSRVALSAGDAVYQGDVIETGADGAINMVFVDQTTFALGDSARLALDEMVYNPATQSGSSSFSILKGVFVFVSGQIAQTDNTKMQVVTPVATIGIRGTKVAGEIKPAGEESKFTVIDGEIAVTTQAGTVVMSDQFATTTVTSFNGAPSAPVILSQSEVNQNYKSVSAVSGGLTNGAGPKGEEAPDEAGPREQAPGDSDNGGEGAAGAEAAGEQAAGEGEGAAEAEGEGEGAADAEGEGVAEAEAEGEGGPQQLAEGEGAPGEGPEGEGGPQQLAEGEGAPGEGPEGEGGEQALLEGEQPPLEGEQALLEGEQQPLEGEQALLEGEQPPLYSGQTLLEGEQPPLEGEQALLEGEQQPLEGEQTQLEGEQQPIYNEQPLVEGEQLANNSGPPPDGGFDDFSSGDTFYSSGDGGFYDGGDVLAFADDGGFGSIDDPFFGGGAFLGDDAFLTEGPLPPPPDDNVVEIIDDELAPDAPVFDDRSGSGSPETLIGGGGNDTLIGGSAADIINGFAGFDTLTGNAGDDTIDGGFGNDSIDGGLGNDLIFGGDGNDIIDGAGGTDTIFGESGNDLIGFDTTLETIDGGAGIDQIQLFGSGQSVNATNLLNVTSIEAINLGGVGSNTLTVDAPLISAVSGIGTLSAIGNGDDVVTTNDSWNLIGPITAGTVTLDQFVSGTVTLDTAVSKFVNLGSVNFNTGAVYTGTLVNQGSLTTSDGTYTNDGSITLSNVGDIDMTGAKTLAGTGTFVNQQSLSLADDTIAATLDGGTGTLGIAGTVTVDGKLILGPSTFVDGSTLAVLNGAGTLVNQGTNAVDDGAAINIDTFINQGVFAFATLSSTITTPTITNEAGAAIDFSVNTTINLATGDTLTNAGLAQISSAVVSFQDGVIANSGTLDVTAASSTLAVTNGTISMLTGGDVVGAGTMALASSNFDIAPGVSFQFGASGAGPTLDIDIGAITGGGAFVNQSEVVIDNATTISVATFTNSNGGTLDHADGTLAVTSASFENQATGTILVDSFNVNTAVNFSNDFTNSGLIEFLGGNQGAIAVGGGTGTLVNAATGVIKSVGGSNTLDGTLVSVSGSEIFVKGNSVLNFNDDFNNVAGATVSIGDGTTTGEVGGIGTITNNGVLSLFNGTLTGNLVNNAPSISVDGANNLNSGTISFDVNTTLFLGVAPDVFSNSGTFLVNNNAVLTVDKGTLANLAGGIINVFGSGTLALTTGGVFSDSGTTTFGLSPGSLTIDGDMLRGDTAFMLFELGGLAPGIHDGFDQLTVTGELAAGGTLDIVEFGGFEVAAGDEFAIINTGTLTGEFRNINGLEVGGGVVLDAAPSGTGVTLTGTAVTGQGTAGDDTLTGSAADDVFVGEGGNDFIVSGGGADLMHGGDGDDVFVAADTGFGRLDGGGGVDTVRFDGGGFDLTGLRGDQLSNIERIDITGTGDNTLTLDADIVFDATGGTNPLTGAVDSLLIDGDTGDAVVAQGAWTNAGTVTIGGDGYTVYESDTNNAQIVVDSDVLVTLV